MANRYKVSNHNVKQCSRCHQLYELTTDNFAVHLSNPHKDGTQTRLLDGYCRECKRNVRRKYFSSYNKAESTRQYQSEWHRDRRAERNFDMPVSQIFNQPEFSTGCLGCGSKSHGQLKPFETPKGEVIGCLCYGCRRKYDNIKPPDAAKLKLWRLHEAMEKLKDD